MVSIPLLRTRRARRVAGTVAVAVVVAVCFVELALPVLVGAWVRSELQERGVDARVDVASVGLSETVIRRISAPALGVEARELVVEYSLGELFRGRVGRVAIAELRWRIDTAAAGRLDPRELHLDAGTAAVARVDVASFVIDVERGAHRMAIVGSGSITSAESGLHATVEGTAAGLAFRGAANVSASASQLWLRGVGPRPLAVDVTTARDSEGGTVVDLWASGRGLQLDVGREAGLGDLAARGHARIVGHQVRELAGRATLREVSLDAVLVDALELEVRQRDRRLQFALSATDPSLGRLALTGSAPASIDQWATVTSVPIAIDVEIDSPESLVKVAELGGLQLSASSPLRCNGAGFLERTGDEWAATLVTATLTSRIDELRVGPNQRLRDADVALSGSGRLTSERMELVLHPGSSLSARELRASLSSFALRTNDRRHSRVAMIAVAPVRAWIDFDAASHGVADWRIAVPAVQLVGRGIALSCEGMRAAASIAVPVAGWLGPQSGAMAVLDGGRLRTAEVTLGSREGGMTAAAATFAVLPSGPSGGYDSRSQRLRVSIRSLAPVAVRGQGRASMDSVRVDATARLRGTELRSVAANVTVDASELRVKELAVGSVGVRVPLQWPRRGGTAARPGWLRLRQASWQRRPLPSLEGTITLAREGWTFAGECRDTSFAVPASATAKHLDLDELVIQVPATPVHLSRADRITRLIAEVGEVDVTGRVAVRANLHFKDLQPVGSAAISFHEVTLADRSRDLGMSGVSGRLKVALDGDGGMKIEHSTGWRSATVAGQRLGGGALRWRTTGPRRLKLEHASVRVGRGRVSVKPLTAVLDGRSVRANLVLSNIELRRWLPVLSRGKLRASGAVDGQLRVRLSTRTGWPTIAAGRLAARGAGRVWFHDRRLLDRLASDAVGATSGSSVRGTLRARLASALADFDYESLTLEFFDAADRPEVRFATQGRGHRVPQDVKLTVNATGVSDFVRAAMQL